MEASDSRQGEAEGTTPARLVAARGMTRSTPGWSQTTQARPMRGLVVTPTRGKVRL